MGSTRLPGKVLLNLAGESVLARVVNRLRLSKLITDIVVATTTDSRDNPIEKECRRLCVKLFRGSELDVLDRYYHAAVTEKADAVVRITSDCPLIDPEIVDETIRVFLSGGADYANNVNPRHFPRGLDTEVFTTAALHCAWREAHEGYQREHVTPYLAEHPEVFRFCALVGEGDYSGHRWTLDTPQDFDLLQAIYSSFSDVPVFGWREVLAFMERHPELRELNSNVLQKSLHG
jgi:spore coat polysaccharide biosynthesis protein SpsF